MQIASDDTEQLEMPPILSKVIYLHLSLSGNSF